MRTSLRIIRKKHQHCKRVKITQIEPKHILPIKMVKSMGPNRKEKKGFRIHLQLNSRNLAQFLWFYTTKILHYAFLSLQPADHIFFNRCLWLFMKLTWLTWLWVGNIDFYLLKLIFWFTEINILIYWNWYQFHLRPSVKFNFLDIASLLLTVSIGTIIN